MAAAGLVRLSAADAAQMARGLERAGADSDGALRAIIDDARWRFAAPDQQFGSPIDVFGPRGTPLSATPRSKDRGIIDLRTGDAAEVGDGVRWNLQFFDGATGEPLADALVAAWAVSPRNFRGVEEPRYLPDLYRGVTRLDTDGKVSVLSHDPPEYLYNGSTLAPHLHGMVVPQTGRHPLMVFEQARMGEFPGGDLDVVRGMHVVPPGHPEGRIVSGPWDPHANARVATSGPDAGFILPTKAPPLL